MKKVYFESEQAAIDFNRAEAEKRGCDMVQTTMWWQIDQDDTGWYLMVDEQTADQHENNSGQ